ncbi:unnamed protein product, partial [Anisakis simplex]|uniref:NUP50 domain-containing protein n=1 Tax=Anisakis simplex TaxID=6269 RepID=A0A0M3J8C7_ANISI
DCEVSPSLSSSSSSSLSTSSTVSATKPSDQTNQSNKSSTGFSFNPTTTTTKISFGGTSSLNDSNKDNTESERRGKKRAKRGGPNEKESEVIISYQSPKTAMPFSFDKQPQSTNTKTTSASSLNSSTQNIFSPKSLFSFGGSAKDQQTTKSDNTVDVNKSQGDAASEDKPKNVVSSPFSFLGASDSKMSSSSTTTNATTSISFGTSKSSSSNDSNTSTAIKPLFTFGKAADNTDSGKAADKLQASSTFKTPVFPSIASVTKGDTSTSSSSSSTIKPLFSFGTLNKDASTKGMFITTIIL